MESLDDVLLEADDKMTKSLEVLKQGFAGLRTGKASPSLVENIMVEYYGAPTRLRQIAGIATPEPRLIVINAYDPTALSAIEKAILAANVGITPINDGRLIRVPIPELSEERRKDLIKVGKRMAEEARISIRGVRRDANEQIKGLQKSGTITEDDEKHGLTEIQKYTDDFIRKVDDLLTAKEKDVLTV